jgi:hypothetical protein
MFVYIDVDIDIGVRDSVILDERIKKLWFLSTDKHFRWTLYHVFSNDHMYMTNYGIEDHPR